MCVIEREQQTEGGRRQDGGKESCSLNNGDAEERLEERGGAEKSKKDDHNEVNECFGNSSVCKQQTLTSSKYEFTHPVSLSLSLDD